MQSQGRGSGGETSTRKMKEGEKTISSLSSSLSCRQAGFLLQNSFPLFTLRHWLIPALALFACFPASSHFTLLPDLMLHGVEHEGRERREGQEPAELKKHIC